MIKIISRNKIIKKKGFAITYEVEKIRFSVFSFWLPETKHYSKSTDSRENSGANPTQSPGHPLYAGNLQDRDHQKK